MSYLGPKKITNKLTGKENIKHLHSCDFCGKTFTYSRESIKKIGVNNFCSGSCKDFLCIKTQSKKQKMRGI